MSNPSIEDINNELTKENCIFWFDKFVARHESQVGSFVKQVNQELGADTLDFSVASLDKAWFYVRDRLERIDIADYSNFENLPIWFRTDTASFYDPESFILSEQTLDLIDKLIYYYAEVVKVQVPNIRWVVCIDEVNHIHNYKPHLCNYDYGNEPSEGFTQAPFIYIWGLAYKEYGQRLPTEVPRTLVTGFELFYGYYQEFLALPDDEKYPPPFMLEVEGRKKKSDWRGTTQSLKACKGYYEVTLTEAAEAELNQQDFDSLPQHFESLDGIEEVFWLDREWLQVATTLTKKKLEEALKEKYTELKARAKQK